jgi:hypothetical protein
MREVGTWNVGGKDAAFGVQSTVPYSTLSTYYCYSTTVLKSTCTPQLQFDTLPDRHLDSDFPRQSHSTDTDLSYFNPMVIFLARWYIDLHLTCSALCRLKIKAYDKDTFLMLPIPQWHILLAPFWIVSMGHTLYLETSKVKAIGYESKQPLYTPKMWLAGQVEDSPSFGFRSCMAFLGTSYSSTQLDEPCATRGWK